ncbi:MutS-related protein [Thomasclavelia spiroformis]|uniref:MutS family DNA mismatch repair protein n=1 Tax=Thomasclavelia spiroformis TaxID=29348 RepID=UPI0039905650
MKYDDYLVVQNKINNDVVSLKKRSTTISLLRFLTMIGCLICLLVGYFFNREYLYIIALVLVILFSYLVYLHSQVTNQLMYFEAKLVVINNYLARFEDKWHSFKENGADYVDKISGLMKDLDIVGNNSLFQYLNTASTRSGKIRLLHKLTRRDYDINTLIEEQEAVKELGDNDDFVIDIETYGKMIKKPKFVEKTVEEFINGIKDYQISYDLKLLLIIIPILTIIMFLMFTFNIMFKVAVIAVAILIFGQWISTLIFLPKHSEIFKQVSDLSKCLNSYQNICRLTLQTIFTSKHLNKLKNQLNQAYEAFNELKKISSIVKQRNNILAAILLNGILLWDFNCKRAYDTWIKKYGNEVESWLDAIGELESLISLQVLLKTKKQTTFPLFSDELCLEFEGAYHPLIDDRKVVANSFMMKKQVCVITGSNMSGKTTFLRTIGTNLVLAFAGGPVMAKSFKCSLMKIYTSMRLEDDLSGISTFYAELLRIKEIVDANNRGEKMIALIDEIFKGTNSKDRIYGAAKTVEQLSSSNIFTFITTHDFELCELENQIPCTNYHFSEYYQDNKIMFDYLIKDGRCKTTNAKYLLKMVGITK